MKPKSSLRSFLALAGSSLLLASQAHAIDYWWDNNDNETGFGTASGTWSGTASLFSTSSTGVVTPTGTQATLSGDQAFFGTDTVGNGLGTGAITVDGEVFVGNMIFGTQTTGTITFNSVNGGKITSGNNTIRVNGTGATAIFNADYSGATTQWFGNSTTIYYGNFKNTGTSTIRPGHTLQFGSTSTVDFANGSRGINFLLATGQTSTIRYSSVNDGLMGAVGNNGDSSSGIFIKDGSATSTLRLAGNNTFLGEYRIEAGTLQFTPRRGLYDGVNTNWLASNIIVGNTGVLGLNVGGTNQFTASDVTLLLGNLGGANGTGTTGFAAGSAIGFDTTNAAGGTFTVADVIADSTGSGGGAIGVRKLGTNTLVLSNTNTYTGATKIAGGTLKLDATGSIDNTSGVSLGTAGTFDVSDKSGYTVSNLTGSGTVIGSLTVSTELAIGSSTGTISFENLTLGDSSTFTHEVLGGGADADLANVSGSLILTEGTVLDLVQLGTYTVGDRFTLFGYETGSLTGTFAGLEDGDEFTAAGGDWKILYDDDTAGINGGTGTSFVTITAIPEPRAALLGGLGLLALLRRRRS
jgi:autotransporter-associated beta strand protein